MRKYLLLTLLVSSFLPIRASAQTWEYKVEEIDLITKVRVFANDVLLSEDDLEDLLQPLGEDGWELTLMVPRGGTSILLVFKRPVTTAAPVVTAPPVVAPPPAPEPVSPDVPEAAPDEDEAPEAPTDAEPSGDGEGNPD